MGKQARQQQRELQAAAQVATDLNMLKTRPFLIETVQIEPIDMMTPMGKTPGCRLTFVMQNGETHPPIILDPIMALTLIGGVGLALTNPAAFTQGSPTPEPPGDHTDSQGVTPTDQTDLGPETSTPSGLIIPS